MKFKNGNEGYRQGGYGESLYSWVLLRTFYYCHHRHFSRASNMKTLVFICFLSFTMHTGHILQAIRLMNTLHHSLCQVLWCRGLALWPTALNTTSCLAYNTVTTNSVHLSREKFICPPNTVAFHPFPQIYAVLLFSITMI